MWNSYRERDCRSPPLPRAALQQKGNLLRCVSFFVFQYLLSNVHSTKILKNKKSEVKLHSFCCGEKGIRTPGTRKSTTVFETAPFDHSGISPCVAEKEGFEPPEPSRVQRFSRPPHSTTLPFLRAVQKYYKLNSRQIYFRIFLSAHNGFIFKLLEQQIIDYCKLKRKKCPFYANENIISYAKNAIN